MARSIGSEGTVSISSNIYNPPSGLSENNWTSNIPWPITTDINYMPYELISKKIPDNQVDLSDLTYFHYCSSGAYIRINQTCVNRLLPSPYDTVYDHINQQITIESINIPENTKLILVVEGNDIDIQGNINLPDTSFFMLVIKDGNLNIDPSVDYISGVYYVVGDADALIDPTGIIFTGKGSAQLVGEGNFLASKFNFERDLGAGNETMPSEKFVFKPSLNLTPPEFLQVRYTFWINLNP